MPDGRPGGEQLRDMIMDDLARHFVVHGRDRRGFWLRRDGRDDLDVRVWASPAEMERYLIDMEQDAYDAMGLEPPWMSALSRARVHLRDEAAMAEPGTSIVIDGDVVRRDRTPEPNLGAPSTASRAKLPGGSADHRRE